ncbi:MAG: hypothetical protein FWF57_04440 [Defluviitaleaceae bacterium]|nr:hypothetical protein [Defluviitaleaceae bacterium]
MEEVLKVKEEFLKCKDTNPDIVNDDEFNNGLLVIEIYEEESEGTDFKKICEIAKPILNRITKLDTWNAKDLNFMSLAIGYTETVEQSRDLFEFALGQLEKYEDYDEWHRNTNAAFSGSFSLRLSRIDAHEREKYINIFVETIDDTIKHFEEQDLQLAMSAALLTKGVFFNDQKTIDMGLDKLKELDKDLAHEMMLEILKARIKERGNK